MEKKKILQCIDYHCIELTNIRNYKSKHSGLKKKSKQLLKRSKLPGIWVKRDFIFTRFNNDQRCKHSSPLTEFRLLVK